jgi:hypothetical protein
MENHFSLLLAKAEKYIKIYGELIKLKAIVSISEVIASLSANLFFIFFASISFLLFEIGLAFWIGDYTGKVYIGFFSIACINLFLLLVAYMFRMKFILMPIKNSIIRKAIILNEKQETKSE